MSLPESPTRIEDEDDIRRGKYTNREKRETVQVMRPIGLNTLTIPRGDTVEPQNIISAINTYANTDEDMRRLVQKRAAESLSERASKRQYAGPHRNTFIRDENEVQWSNPDILNYGVSPVVSSPVLSSPNAGGSPSPYARDAASPSPYARDAAFPSPYARDAGSTPFSHRPHTKRDISAWMGSPLTRDEMYSVEADWKKDALVRVNADPQWTVATPQSAASNQSPSGAALRWGSPNNTPVQQPQGASPHAKPRLRWNPLQEERGWVLDDQEEPDYNLPVPVRGQKPIHEADTIFRMAGTRIATALFYHGFQTFAKLLPVTYGLAGAPELQQVLTDKIFYQPTNMPQVGTGPWLLQFIKFVMLFEQNFKRYFTRRLEAGESAQNLRFRVISEAIEVLKVWKEEFEEAKRKVNPDPHGASLRHIPSYNIGADINEALKVQRKKEKAALLNDSSLDKATIAKGVYLALQEWLARQRQMESQPAVDTGAMARLRL